MPCPGRRPGAAAALALAIVAVAASCLPSRACLPGTSRPAGLEAVGVRAGGDWLAKETFHEDARLGSITHIVQRSNADIAIVGTRAAVFLSPAGGSPRMATFRPATRDARLVEGADGSARYIDRGGGGWRTGAFIGEDGARLWQPDGLGGMNDLAGGDVDGDGVPELAVGYNGSGGVHLLDAAGRRRWREDDGNVWHVEIVDTDGDGRREIVHSNAGGELTIRDAGGKVRRRAKAEAYLSRFSLVEWPPGRSGLLHAGDGVARVLNFDGTTRASFATPDTTFLGDAHGAQAHLGPEDYLVLALSMSRWDRTQLFVFDHNAALRYREVVRGRCAVAAPEPFAFLFGCGPRVLRYTLRR